MQPLPDMNQLMKLAASPAGQKLIALLQSDKSIDLQKLSQSASTGNLEDARHQLAGFLSSQEAQTLLKKLEQPYE